MLELLKRVWGGIKSAAKYIRNAIFGKPYAPYKYSAEFAAALKQPVVPYRTTAGADSYALNTGLDLAKWSVKFTDAPTPNPEKKPKLLVEIETPRLKFRQIGLGTPEQQKADIDFYTSMYADAKVTVTYASGKPYTYAEAFMAAVGRFYLFMPRTTAGKPFTGFIAELHNGTRVGVLNVGQDNLNTNATTVDATPAPLALNTKTSVVPAVMLASDFHGQGFRTEACVAGMLYLAKVKEKGYKTLAMADDNDPSLGYSEFHSVAFTSRPNDPVPERLGAERVGISSTYGSEATNIRDVRQISAQKLVDIATSTVERDAAANRRTIRI